MGNSCNYDFSKCQHITNIHCQNCVQQIKADIKPQVNTNNPKSQEIKMIKNQQIYKQVKTFDTMENSLKNQKKMDTIKSNKKINVLKEEKSSTVKQSQKKNNQEMQVSKSDLVKQNSLVKDKIQQKNQNQQQQITLNILNQEEEIEFPINIDQKIIEKKQIQVNWGSFIKFKRKNVNLQYQIIGQLGKGAFGSVKKVKLKSTGLIRAMKSIKKNSLIKQDQQRIFAEMLILKNLDHPHIIKLYQIYDWKNYYYLITQLCQGGELFDRIRKLKYFSQKDAAEVMRNLLSALVYLHNQNIVHRDLKPQNLMYIDQTSNHLKIIDFGTSKKVQKNIKLTKQIGTAYYIAPQILNKKYDIKCDVWSCGVILYTLLCGYPPFRGNSQAQIFQNIQLGILKFQNKSWKNISPDAIELIKKMLNRNPQQRLTALEAYNSNWIHKTHKSTPLEAHALDNIRNFHFQNRLEAVVMTYIASQVYSNKDKQQLQRVFKQLDTDGDGVIEKQQLIAAFQYCYRDFKYIDINKILKLIDTNNSGKIDFTEFLVAASSQQQLLKLNRLQNAFSYFDVDHSGYISIDQIKMFLTDEKDTKQSIQKIFSEVDENHDGQLSKSEFIKLLIKHK